MHMQQGSTLFNVYSKIMLSSLGAIMAWNDFLHPKAKELLACIFLQSAFHTKTLYEL